MPFKCVHPPSRKILSCRHLCKHHMFVCISTYHPTLNTIWIWNGTKVHKFYIYRFISMVYQLKIGWHIFDSVHFACGFSFSRSRFGLASRQHNEFQPSYNWMYCSRFRTKRAFQLFHLHVPTLFEFSHKPRFWGRQTSFHTKTYESACR
jgi:hypothetical protein